MIKAHTIAQKQIIFVLLALLLSLGQASAQPNENTTENSPEENNSTEEQADAKVSPTPAPRKKIDIEKQRISLLSEELQNEDLTWLEGEDEKFMGLWLDDKTGNPFGAVLILHGEGQSAAWPHTVDSIRKNLVHYGWATLAISLPAQKKPKVPKRPIPTPVPEPPSGSEANDEVGDPDDLADVKTNEEVKQTEEAPPAAAIEGDTQNDEPDIDPEQQSRARLKSAFNFLNQKGHYNIVAIGQGTGAMRAAQYIDKLTGGSAGKMQRPVRAIVFIEARNRINAKDENRISDFINDPGLPILDIYFGDHFLDEMETKDRKAHARASNIKHFYQIKILPPQASTISTENRLTRRIRGFLNKHAKGVEIERR